MIISFAWTTEALRAGKKTVTRRKWSDDYAAKFKKGDKVDAYDKSPRSGGKKVATIVLTCDPYKEALGKMTLDELDKEGGLWPDIMAFIDPFGLELEDEVWVIRFQVIEFVEDFL